MYQDLDCLYFLFRITLVDNCNDRHRIIQIIVDISSSCHTAKGEKSDTNVDNGNDGLIHVVGDGQEICDVRRDEE